MTQTSSIRLYQLDYSRARTYLYAALFVIGNIAVPQLFHLMPDGGHIWLPIYFLTLIAAYKYGWRVGLLTALASPVVNSLLFGMPAVAALPAIMLKSVLLALIAGFIADRYRRASLLMLAGVVIAYQVLGSLGEWLITGSLAEALADFRLGIPGMLLQAIGGWLVINTVLRR